MSDIPQSTRIGTSGITISAVISPDNWTVIKDPRAPKITRSIIRLPNGYGIEVIDDLDADNRVEVFFVTFPGKDIRVTDSVDEMPKSWKTNPLKDDFYWQYMELADVDRIYQDALKVPNKE